jgi:hypothetical protein
MYIKTHQLQLRADQYRGLSDAVINDNIQNPVAVGRPVILPSSFYGSKRYLNQRYQDAMAMVHQLGHPDIFLTITTNPQWPEITNALDPLRNETAVDRPDIVNRVFYMKLDEFMSALTKEKVLGNVIGEFRPSFFPFYHSLNPQTLIVFIRVQVLSK